MKNEKSKPLKLLTKIVKSRVFLFLLGGAIFGSLSAGAVTYFASGDVSYDNSVSGLKSTDVQSAIDELYNECFPSTPPTIYAWNTNTITVGTSRVEDLESTKTPKTYYESAEEVMSASGYNVFNKYTVVDDVITEGYSCTTFGVLSTPVCVQGVDPAYYNYQNSPGNWSVLNTLNSNETFTSAGGSCYFSSSYSSCYVGGFSLNADSNGGVDANVFSADADCGVRDDGYASCYEL